MQLFKILSILLFFTSYTRAQQQEVPSQVSDVTVFLNNAAITHQANVTIPQGTSKVVVKDFPANIDQNSLQVKGKGAFTLLSVAFERDFLNKKSAELEEKIEGLKQDIEDLELEKDILSKEEDMLMDNSEIGSEELGVEKEKLKAMQAYFRENLRRIAKEELKYERTIEKLKENKNDLEKQLSVSKNQSKPLGKVILTVKAERATQASLEISYVAYNCRWSPNYDIRVKDIDSPVNITYKAMVFQSTGIDWDKVDLTLSTSNPNKGTIKPLLNPKFLMFESDIIESIKGRAAGMQLDREKSYLSSSIVKIEGEEMIDASNFVQTVETSLSLDFKIDIPYSIPSSNKAEEVVINDVTLPATYKYHVVPQFDKDAFLMASMKDFEAYNFLPGQMNVYFEGEYVGKAYMPNLETKNDLEISLGRDARIITKRVALTDFKSKKTFGSNIRQDFKYRIEVKNNRSKEITVQVEDQYPISKNSEIDVSLDAGGALENKEKGTLTWELNVPSNGMESKTFGYQVKYPKGKTVNNL